MEPREAGARAAANRACRRRVEAAPRRLPFALQRPPQELHHQQLEAVAAVSRSLVVQQPREAGGASERAQDVRFEAQARVWAERHLDREALAVVALAAQHVAKAALAQSRRQPDGWQRGGVEGQRSSRGEKSPDGRRGGRVTRVEPFAPGGRVPTHQCWSARQHLQRERQSGVVRVVVIVVFVIVVVDIAIGNRVRSADGGAAERSERHQRHGSDHGERDR